MGEVTGVWPEIRKQIDDPFLVSFCCLFKKNCLLFAMFVVIQGHKSLRPKQNKREKACI